MQTSSYFQMRARFLLLALLVSGVSAPARAQSGFTLPGRSPLRILGYALGGAIVGSWTGYVASQVTWSDWRDTQGRSAHRIRYSIGGAALGLAVGVVMGSHRTLVAPTVPLAPPRLAPPLPNRPITGNEIRASFARTVRDLIRSLRPQWLRRRGRDVLPADSLHVGQDPLAAPGVRVYLNGQLVGGLETLDEVSVDALTRVEFFEAAAAVLRWGAGNDDGAIHLITR